MKHILKTILLMALFTLGFGLTFLAFWCIFQHEWWSLPAMFWAVLAGMCCCVVAVEKVGKK